MRNLSTIIIFFVLVNALGASELIVNSELKSVKVFLRGAELTHSATFEFSRGSNTIVINGLANNINQNSLNIKGAGEFLILETKLSKDYLLEREKNEVIKTLEDSLKTLQNDINLINADIEVGQSEISLILANQKLGTDTKAPSVTEIKKMQEFYKKELTGLHKEIINYNKKIEKLNETIERIRKQLDEMNNYQHKGSSEILVTIIAEQKGKGSIELKYFTYDAGWQASYDVRVENINSPLQLNQKGMIWQNTGLNWNDMNISLSTGNPSLGSYIPELSPWHLDFYREYGLQKSRGAAVNDQVLAEAVVVSALPAKPGIMSDYVTVEQNQLTYEFVTPIKYTILSDNKKHMVQLKDYEIEANYSYYSIPKLSDDAFLTAIIKDWKNNPILPGEANIFFDNTFVGRTTLSPGNTEEEIKLSLGQDPNVSVKRESVKDFSEDKFLSSDVERKFSYKLTVKNNKTTDVNLVLEDQIPISNQEEIEVKLLNPDGATMDKETGKLTWTLKISPGSTIEKNLSFNVRYPGDKEIQGL